MQDFMQLRPIQMLRFLVHYCNAKCFSDVSRNSRFCKVLIHKCGNKLERNIQEEVNNKEIVKGMIVLSLLAN